MLVDQAIITVISGRGGDGHVSFRREKYINKGGPNGGDGGNGGNVYLVATAGVDTLLDFSGRHVWQAQDGQPGGIKQCHGAKGQDLIVKLPPGTLVYDDQSAQLLGDLDEPGKQLLIAKAGRGGFGNEHFKSPIHQTPTEASPGQPGEKRRIRLELKLIADVGVVGLPNAGKSTLLSRVSAARPKIGAYPFTTLEPNLGIAELSGDRRIVFADIPGIIEGAHDGKGLGAAFLRHVERTRVLVHMLDIDPADRSDPIHNYKIIRDELAGYSPLLAQKPQIVCLSKMDLLATEADRAAAVELIRNQLGVPVMPVSAASGVGLTDLLDACWKLLQEHPRPPAAEAPAIVDAPAVTSSSSPASGRRESLGEGDER